MWERLYSTSEIIDDRINRKQLEKIELEERFEFDCASNLVGYFYSLVLHDNFYPLDYV